MFVPIGSSGGAGLRGHSLGRGSHYWQVPGGCCRTQNGNDYKDKLRVSCFLHRLLQQIIQNSRSYSRHDGRLYSVILKLAYNYNKRGTQTSNISTTSRLIRSICTKQRQLSSNKKFTGHPKVLDTDNYSCTLLVHTSVGG